MKRATRILLPIAAVSAAAVVSLGIDIAPSPPAAHAHRAPNSAQTTSGVTIVPPHRLVIPLDGIYDVSITSGRVLLAVNVTARGRVRPARLRFADPDGSRHWRRINWGTSWGKPVAVGKGQTRRCSNDSGCEPWRNATIQLRRLTLWGCLKPSPASFRAYSRIVIPGPSPTRMTVAQPDLAQDSCKP